MGEVIILGAGGFIGKDIAEFFLKRLPSVELYSKHSGSICGIPVKKIDLTKNASKKELSGKKKVKSLIYLSAAVPNNLNSATWELFIYNLKMHENVLECWQKLNCHLIYASSCSVYRQNKLSPWRESDVVNPKDYYSFSKIFGELMFLRASKKYKLPLTVLRINSPFKVDSKHKTVVNAFIDRALKDKDILLYGSGNRNQDFLYISDLARAFWAAYKRKAYGIFNIASGKTVTMRKLAEIIIRLTGSSSRIVLSHRLDAQEHIKVNIDVSKSKRGLRFIPLFSLEQGLKECILKYRRIPYENWDCS